MSVVTLQGGATVRRTWGKAAMRPWAAVNLLVALFPVWWALGLSGIVIPLAAIPIGLRLWVLPRVRVPTGFGWYAAFVAWVLLSAINLPEPQALVFFGWRFLTYLACGVILLGIYNASEAELPTESVLRSLSVLWVSTIAGGYLALRFPNLNFASPMEFVLPGVFTSNDFVARFIHPQVADVQGILGTALPRPAAPFVYTNNWGSGITMLLPFAMLLATLVGTHAIRRTVLILGLAALPPFVYSLNRTAWFSLIVIAAVVVITAAPRNRARALGASLGAGVLVVSLVVFTPLGNIVTDRFEHAHSNETREDLASQSFEVTNESPLVGYGRPLPNVRFPLRSEIGTQGFFWTLMVLHGYVGLGMFAVWLLGATARAWWGRRRPEARTALMVLAAFLVQLPFYDMIPYQLCFIAIAIALERRGAAARAPGVPS
jgi:hypothetical protein